MIISTLGLMFGVCSPHPQREIWLNQWEYLFAHFAPDCIWVLNAPDDARYYSTVNRIATLAELPESPLILLAAPSSQYVRGDKSLMNFEHPKSAIYLFGGDHINFSERDFRDRAPDHRVYVPTASHDETYSWIAGAITFYDRAVKLG